MRCMGRVRVEKDTQFGEELKLLGGVSEYSLLCLQSESRIGGSWSVLRRDKL